MAGDEFGGIFKSGKRGGGHVRTGEREGAESAPAPGGDVRKKRPCSRRPSRSSGRSGTSRQGTASRHPRRMPAKGPGAASGSVCEAGVGGGVEQGVELGRIGKAHLCTHRRNNARQKREQTQNYYSTGFHIHLIFF